MAMKKEAVYKEYGMTPQGIASDVLAIKNWLLKQPHLPIIRADLLSVHVDEWLENYLISCKNSLERVKEGLDMYFTSKILIPEVFTHRDPLQQAFITSFNVMCLAILPRLTPSSRRVLVFSHLRDDADDFDPVVMIKRVGMMLDVLLQEGVDHVGLEVIIDSKNVCFAQLTRYNLALTRKVMDIGLKALPQRLHRIRIVNPTPLVDTGISFFKPLLQKKLQSRIVVHRELKDLHEAIPAEMLPKDLGGMEPTIAQLNDSWREKLECYRDWFRITDSVKSDESKRIGKCRYETKETTFGNQGSFRKIEVD